MGFLHKVSGLRLVNWVRGFVIQEGLRLELLVQASECHLLKRCVSQNLDEWMSNRLYSTLTFNIEAL